MTNHISSSTSSLPHNETQNVPNLKGRSSLYLIDDVDAVIQLLSLQDRVEVVEPELEVLIPVPKRYDDGNLLQGDAVFGCVAPARSQAHVILHDLLQRDGGFELHLQRAHWTERGGGCSEIRLVSPSAEHAFRPSLRLDLQQMYFNSPAAR